MAEQKIEFDPLPTTKAELADFIEALREDLLKNKEEWENPTLESYLEAMAAWTRSMDNYYRNTGQQTPDVPSWSTLADILLAAKIYE